MLLYNRTQPNRNTIIIRSQLRNNNVAKHLATANTNDFVGRTHFWIICMWTFGLALQRLQHTDSAGQVTICYCYCC